MFSSPEDNIKYLTLADGMTVADFGTGTGAYAIALGKRVGPRGTVYAIDVQKQMLPHVVEAATRAGVGNVKTIWGIIDEVGGTKLADHIADAVVISNVLFQSEDKLATAKEASRLLKIGGEILLIDWTGASTMGAHPDQVVTKAKAEEIFKQIGFKVERSFDAGAHHYGIVFKMA